MKGRKKSRAGCNGRAEEKEQRVNEVGREGRRGGLKGKIRGEQRKKGVDGRGKKQSRVQ